MVADDFRDDSPVEEPTASSSQPDPALAEGKPEDVTRILSAIEEGNGQAAQQLLPLVYDTILMTNPSKRALSSACIGWQQPPAEPLVEDGQKEKSQERG
jgi:hypothetical protein